MPRKGGNFARRSAAKERGCPPRDPRPEDARQVELGSNRETHRSPDYFAPIHRSAQIAESPATVPIAKGTIKLGAQILRQ